MTRSSAGNAYPFALLAVLFWSTSPTAFKIGLRYQEPFQLLTGAAYTSTVVLGLILFLRGRDKWYRPGWKDLGFSALMGLLNPVAYYLVLFAAYSILPAQVAQPLNMVWPLVLVLLSIPILGQRIGWRSIGAMAISFTGVVILSLQDGTSTQRPENLQGVVLALTSSVIWSLYFLFNTRGLRTSEGPDPVLRLFLNFLAASIFLSAWGWSRGRFVPSSPDAWFASAYVGVFEMGITFVLWLTALKKASSTDRIGNLVFMAPFLNLFPAHLVLHERIYYSTVFGIILLVAGILFQKKRLTHGKTP